MFHSKKIILGLCLAALLAGGGVVLAQFGGGLGGGLPGGGGLGGPGGSGGRGGRGGGRGGFGGGGFGGGGVSTGPYVRLEGINGGYVNEDTVKTARETMGHSVDLPTWSNPPGFNNDVFTFARIIFKSQSFGFGRGGGGRGWVIDYPDADINLSFRLHQFTSMKVDPDCRVLHLTDTDLPRFPLIYMEHVERILLSDAENQALRKYLNDGGALLVNDTWGDAAAQHFMDAMKLVLPNRPWTELSMDHPLFHCVFDLQGPINHLQVPTMQFLNYDYDPTDPNSKPTRARQAGWENVHFWALHDDHQRIMILFINNSDVSDGWEREGENETYFHLFSEKRAYPLAINIFYYFMTH